MDTQTLQNNKWARRAAWTLGGVAALWAISWLAVPPLLKHYAQKIASEKLGRAVTLGEVDFRPWSLALTLSDLAIATADGKSDQLRIKRLYIDSELQSLLRLAPVVDAITVDEPVARLTHTGEGRYDIDDILQRLAPPADQPPGEPARFALYNLALNGGSLDFTDQTVGKTHTLRDVRLAVPFLSNLESKREVHTEPQLAFKLNGSAFDSAGQTTPFAQTRKTDATVKLQAMDLTPYLGYIPASVPVRLLAAVVDADIKVAFEQNPAPAVRLSGVVQVSRVKLADTQQQELLAFDSLKAVLADVRPLAQTVKLASVELTAPTLTVHRAGDGRLNLDLSAPPAQGMTKTSKTIAKKDQRALAEGQKDAKNFAFRQLEGRCGDRCGARWPGGLDRRHHGGGQGRHRAPGAARPDAGRLGHCPADGRARRATDSLHRVGRAGGWHRPSGRCAQRSQGGGGGPGRTGGPALQWHGPGFDCQHDGHRQRPATFPWRALCRPVSGAHAGRHAERGRSGWPGRWARMCRPCRRKRAAPST